jgi:preprotein translocase subunit SecG
MVNLKYCNVRSLEGGVDMHALLVTLLVIVCIALIAVVLLQSGRSAGLSGAITGGAEQLFGKQKARGIDAVLHRVTVVLAVLFFVLTIAVTYFQL